MAPPADTVQLSAASRACVILVASSMVALVALITIRVGQPSDATVVQVSNSAWRADELRIDFVLDRTSALRPGDVVTAVDGIPLAALAQAEVLANAGRPGARHVYTVMRDGETVAVPVVLAGFPLASLLISSWPMLLLLVLLFSVAVYVFWKRPEDPSARYLLIIAGLLWPGACGWLIGDQVFTLATTGPSPALLLSEVPLAMVWGIVLLFILTFPGAPGWTSRRLPRVVALSAPAVLYIGFLVLVLPAAGTAFEAGGLLLQVSLPASSVLPLASAALFLIVYLQVREPGARRNAGWLAASVGMSALLWTSIWNIPPLLGLPQPDTRYVALTLLPGPIAVGVAVLQFRLLDLDPVRRRSLIKITTATSVVIAAVGLGWGTASVWKGPPLLVAPIVAGFVALLAPPLSAAIRARLVRRVLGERDEPQRIVASLHQERLRESGQEQLTRLTGTLAAALKLSFVSIELAGSGAVETSASHGVDRGLGLRIPLTYGQETIGRLVLDAGPHREPLGSADEQMLETLRAHVASVAYNVLATGRLQLAREGLVTAREEQRRRLHNRLHDGLGASLAATRMKAEAATRLMARQPERAAELMNDVMIDCVGMVGELREVVLDLRPPALAELGLTAAIEQRARQLTAGGRSEREGMEVRVRQRGSLDQPPAAVEVAAYWIAVEAINNAARHAQARTCWVTLNWRTRREPVLDLRIRDNGHGVPADVRQGGGTVSMKQRAEELGGQLVVDRLATGGTLIRAVLPLHLGRPSGATA